MAFTMYTGQIAQIAQDQIRSREVSAEILGDSVTAHDLRVVVNECCFNIHQLAIDEHGSNFLLNLVRKLYTLRVGYEIAALIDAFTEDSEKLMQTVGLNRVGSKVLFSMVEYQPYKRSEVYYILKQIFIQLFFYSDDLKHFSDDFFKVYNNSHDIKTLLCEAAHSFLLLAKSDFGNKNLLSFLESAGYGIGLFVSYLEDDFWKAAYHQKGNKLLQQLICPELVKKLSGKFRDISFHKYGHFVVQRCFVIADCRSCLSISEELDPIIALLIKNEYGNYVVQDMLRRYIDAKWDLPQQLAYILHNKRTQLHEDVWGKEVLLTYDNLMRSPGF